MGTPSTGVLLRIQTNAMSHTRTILGTAPDRSLGSRTAKNPSRRSWRRLVSRKRRRQGVLRSAEYTSAIPRYAHLPKMIASYRRVQGAQKFDHARRHSHFGRSCVIFFTRRLVPPPPPPPPRWARGGSWLRFAEDPYCVCLHFKRWRKF